MTKASSTMLGYEDKLWLAADKLIGLIFLKYVSDAFENKYDELQKYEYADVEDRDEYISENIFCVQKKQGGVATAVKQAELMSVNLI